MQNSNVRSKKAAKLEHVFACKDKQQLVINENQLKTFSQNYDLQPGRLISFNPLRQGLEQYVAGGHSEL